MTTGIRRRVDRDGWWTLHDVIVGTIGGAATGYVVAAFASSRIAGDSGPWLAWGALLGAIAFVTALRFERRRRDDAGPVTVAAWVIGTACALFTVGIIVALSNFE